MITDLKKEDLQKAGCTEEDTETIIELIQCNHNDEALQKMKRCRCNLLDEYHESGRKIDRMDQMIRYIEKNRED